MSPIQGTPPRGGLVLTPKAGDYAEIPVCRPDDFMHALNVALEIPEVETLRRQLRVAGPETVLRAAREYAAAADHRTGRGVAVSHATVAATIGYKPETVKRIARFLSRLGFLIEVARGRNMLTRQERAQARAMGAKNQTAVASTRALTIPRTVYGTPLPVSREVNETSPVTKNSPKRACRPQEAAPRPRSSKKTSRPARTFTIPMYRLASELVNAVPRLLWTRNAEPRRASVTGPGGRPEPVWAGGRHVGQICDALQRWKILENGWTTTEILARVTAYRAAARISEPPGDQLRDPLAWFMALVHAAIGQREISPSRRLAAERDQAHAEATARRRADAEARARADAGRDESAAIIAAMWAQRPPATTRPRTLQVSG